MCSVNSSVNRLQGIGPSPDPNPDLMLAAGVSRWVLIAVGPLWVHVGMDRRRQPLLVILRDDSDCTDDADLPPVPTNVNICHIGNVVLFPGVCVCWDQQSAAALVVQTAAAAHAGTSIQLPVKII